LLEIISKLKIVSDSENSLQTASQDTSLQ
jgi:hypothetical protein